MYVCVCAYGYVICSVDQDIERLILKILLATGIFVLKNITIKTKYHFDFCRMVSCLISSMQTCHRD